MGVFNKAKDGIVSTFNRGVAASKNEGYQIYAAKGALAGAGIGVATAGQPDGSIDGGSVLYGGIGGAALGVLSRKGVNMGGGSIASNAMSSLKTKGSAMMNGLKSKRPSV